MASAISSLPQMPDLIFASTLPQAANPTRSGDNLIVGKPVAPNPSSILNTGNAFGATQAVPRGQLQGVQIGNGVENRDGEGQNPIREAGSYHQERIRRAALEQEWECGVLANENSPRLSRDACDRIRERRLGRLSPTLLDISFPHLFKDIDFLTFVDTLSPIRPEKMTATYELELYGYSAYEFDLLAGEYLKLNPTARDLSEWLLNLSGLVEKEVFRLSRLRWDIHLSREMQKEVVQSSLKDCVTKWLTEPRQTETVVNNGSAPRQSDDENIPEQPGSANCFSDPEIDRHIQTGTARLRARILEADAECTISNFDDFLVETMVENLDLHANAYLRKVTEESLVKGYITYLRNIGSELLRNAEERSHLQDPYSEKRLRETAETTGSLVMRRSKLTGEQYENEVQKLIEEGRAAMLPKAVAWHAWKNQIVARIFSRMEARYSHWNAEASSQLSASKVPSAGASTSYEVFASKKDHQPGTDSVKENGEVLTNLIAEVYPRGTGSALPVSRVKSPPHPNLGQQFALNNWAELKIEFLSDERVQFHAVGRTATGNYGEIGFMDGRSKKPNVAWLTLKQMAEGEGIVSCAAGNVKSWPTVEKAVQSLRKSFKAIFGLDEDPIPFVPGQGYVTQFRIRCSASYLS